MKGPKKTQYTGEELRAMRTKLGISMKKFWGALGYSMTRGCAYETSRTNPPEHVHRLVHLHYVVGIPTDISSPEFAEFQQGLKDYNPARVTRARQMLEEGGRIIDEAKQELKT